MPYPRPYTPRNQSALTPNADLGAYLRQELLDIKDTLTGCITMLPQPATAAPAVPYDGMQRLARSPWRPIGGSVDAWVYYDLPTTSWKAL